MSMTPKITPEMRDELERHPGQPVEVEDDQTRKVYLLFDRDTAQKLFREWLLGELQVGFDAAERGDVAPFDPEAVKAAGRERMRSSH